MSKRWTNALGLVGIVALVVAVYGLVDDRKSKTRIAFVNTQKLMTGFKPAYEVGKQLDEEDGKFKSSLKILEDSLKVFLDSMSAGYDKADAAKKKQWQDRLAFRNQEINNISRAHARKMDEERMKRMQGVYDKINVFMAEFGKREKYSIIFGTVQGGNIIFGEGTPADITQKVMDALNERYE